MAKKKKEKAKPKSGLTDMDEEAETRALEEWLRMVEKPLASRKGDKRGKRKGRGAKRRGK